MVIMLARRKGAADEHHTPREVRALLAEIEGVLR